MNRTVKDSLAAIATVTFVATVTVALMNQDPPPQFQSNTSAVTITVKPTATVTVTAEPTSTPTVTVTAKPERASRSSTRTSVWDRLAQCESGGNWASNVGLYDGGLQFHPKYWPHYAEQAGVSARYAWQATREEQIRVAEIMRAERGWKPWPHCSAQLGL